MKRALLVLLLVTACTNSGYSPEDLEWFRQADEEERIEFFTRLCEFYSIHDNDGNDNYYKFDIRSCIGHEYDRIEQASQ